MVAPRKTVWLLSTMIAAFLVGMLAAPAVSGEDGDADGAEVEAEADPAAEGAEGAKGEEAGDASSRSEEGDSEGSGKADAVSGRLGKDVPLQDRFFRRPRDFFMRSVAGDRFQTHYERFDKHQENIPTEGMSPSDAHIFQTQRLRKRPVYDIVGYSAEDASVRVWIPEGFDEEEIGEWGLFLYVSSENEPDVPERLRGILTEHKLIFASPNGAGADKPDVLRISLVLDTLKLMQDSYRRMHRRKTVVYGEGEAGQIALLSVMNFPDRFANCAVIPVDTSLTMTLRYQAGTTTRLTRTGTEQAFPYYYPVSAPYLSPTEYRKMNRVTFLYVLTNRKALNDHYPRIMDWVELTVDRRFRPFWYPGGLTSEGMGVLLQALEGRRQVLNQDSVPEDIRPELESDRR